MPQTVFRGIISFLADIGVYDVILPFVLSFSIVFAILEKTKVLGTEKIKIDGKLEDVTRKNLNSMVAFVVAFLVVASGEIVRVINEAMANLVVLILVLVMFLMFVGSVAKSENDGFMFKADSKWYYFMISLILAGVLLIFLNALDWLEPFWDYLVDHWQTNAVGSVILLLLVVFFMAWMTRAPSGSNSSASSKGGSSE